MPSVEILDLNNTAVGSIELADSVFAAEVNEALLYEAVKQYTAARRSGSAATKTRHEVSGSGKKLWKQKGTGRARMGSIRSPLWRHGGTVHGPQPRSYEYKLPRKMVLGALRSALSAKLRDGELRVVRAFELADHKTKNMLAVLGKFAATKSVLLVEVGENQNLDRATGNLKHVKTGADERCHGLRPAAARAGVAERRRSEEIIGGTGEVNVYDVIRRPLITEKGHAKREEERTLCFEVHPDANKIEIKQAVETVFRVRVADVRTTNFAGKLRRRGRFSGYASDWKKAYVRLSKGQKVPEYAEI